MLPLVSFSFPYTSCSQSLYHCCTLVRCCTLLSPFCYELFPSPFIPFPVSHSSVLSATCYHRLCPLSSFLSFSSHVFFTADSSTSYHRLYRRSSFRPFFLFSCSSRGNLHCHLIDLSVMKFLQPCVKRILFLLSLHSNASSSSLGLPPSCHYRHCSGYICLHHPAATARIFATRKKSHIFSIQRAVREVILHPRLASRHHSASPEVTPAAPSTIQCLLGYSSRFRPVELFLTAIYPFIFQLPSFE